MLFHYIQVQMTVKSRSFFARFLGILLLGFLLKPNSLLFLLLRLLLLRQFDLPFDLLDLILKLLRQCLLLFHLLCELVVGGGVWRAGSDIIFEGLSEVCGLFFGVLYGKKDWVNEVVHFTMSRIMSFWTRYCRKSLSFSCVFSYLLRIGCSVLLSTLYIRSNIFIQPMPKVVDNYVLERKIGSGQFGDVFKGYNKLNREDIAIKAIKRQSLKGKFNQLLENEIKVLRTCDNPNIIKLYDLKKTANNIYLILQYCNEGDLMVRIKQKKFLNEDESVEYLVQILNAFKTLVKNKIMHRDFKLANILLHDGEIKIADFGFAKLLSQEDYTSTMLGSPLNMAPEVLGGTDYNNKADIWSIGTVFYQMLFGKPPYTASNMVDLIANIKNKPLVIPKNANPISPVTQDILRKMIVVDPKKRIQWQDLFKHPINHFLQDKMQKQLQNTLHVTQDLSLNMSKFYMKNNMVIDHPHEIQQKEQINEYALDVVKGKGNKEFKGELIKRTNVRKEEEGPKQEKTQVTEENDDKIGDKETERELEIKSFKRNSNRLLHHRNIYVFLASVAEQAMSNTHIKTSEIAGFLLVRKLMSLIQWLKVSMDNKKMFAEMESWEKFIKQKDYTDIKQYIEKEYEVFRVFYESIYAKLKEKVKQFDPEVQDNILNMQSASDSKVLDRILRQYIKDLMNSLSLEMGKQKNVENFRKQWIHVDRMLDCLELDKAFPFENHGQTFNFRNYYSQNDNLSTDDLLNKVQGKCKRLKC